MNAEDLGLNTWGNLKENDQLAFGLQETNADALNSLADNERRGS